MKQQEYNLKQLKANNIIDEYLVNRNILEVKTTILEKIGKQSNAIHLWVGYFLIYADSKQKKENEAINLLLLILFKDKVIPKNEFLKGILVHLANFYDALIDFPLCEGYFGDLLSLLISEKVFDGESVKQLKVHAVNIKRKLLEDYSS